LVKRGDFINKKWHYYSQKSLLTSLFQREGVNPSFIKRRKADNSMMSLSL
jgi:hypothetical protein